MINICIECLDGKPGDIFYKSKDKIYTCSKHSKKNNNYLPISPDEKSQLRDEYLGYFQKVKIDEGEFNRIKKLLN